MHESEVKYDSETDEYFLEFSDELMKDLDWKIGDDIVWKDNEDGTFTLYKKSE